MNIMLATKYMGLLLREKNSTEDRDLVLGQQLKPEDSDSSQRKEEWSVRWGEETRKIIRGYKEKKRENQRH